MLQPLGKTGTENFFSDIISRRCVRCTADTRAPLEPAAARKDDGKTPFQPGNTKGLRSAGAGYPERHRLPCLLPALRSEAPLLPFEWKPLGLCRSVFEGRHPAGFSSQTRLWGWTSGQRPARSPQNTHGIAGREIEAHSDRSIPPRETRSKAELLIFPNFRF